MFKTKINWKKTILALIMLWREFPIFYSRSRVGGLRQVCILLLNKINFSSVNSTNQSKNCCESKDYVNSIECL
jgi:hypothetical protein